MTRLDLIFIIASAIAAIAVFALALPDPLGDAPVGTQSLLDGMRSPPAATCPNCTVWKLAGDL